MKKNLAGNDVSSYGNIFLLTEAPGKLDDLQFMITHELMHDFASNELIKLYIKYINGS